MKISIVTTMYHSAPYLEEFFQRMKSSVEKITDNYEIIFVNDGSPDTSSEIIRTLMLNHSHITLIELSRNFSHHKAIMTGLQHTNGDYIFLIDCDLEEEPESLIQFWQIMQQVQNSGKQIDLIHGVQEKRKGSWFEQISGELFFKILNFFSDIPIAVNPLLARLMTRRFLNSLLQFKEQALNYACIDTMTGYERMVIPLKKGHKEQSSYTISKKIKLAIHFITAVSAKPLIYIFYLGILVTLFSIIIFFYLIIRKLLYGIPLAGWTSVIASVWFFGGLLIFCMGTVALYISVIFLETKNRPYSIIKNIVKNE